MFKSFYGVYQVMESYSINPIFQSFLNSQTQETGIFERKRRENNWKKGILAIAVVGILLVTAGVPIYNVIFAAEGNAIPLEFGSIGNIQVQSASGISGMGNLIDFELTHWGATPTEQALVDFLVSLFTSYGIYVGSDVLAAIGYAILASGWSEVAIIAILGLDLTNPVGLVILGAMAVAIISY